MSQRMLLNASLIPHDGTWRYTTIGLADAIAWLRAGPFISYVGYEQTASYLSQISGIQVTVNRAPIGRVAFDDTILICRLKYRVNPNHKGQWQHEDFEFARLERIL